MVRWSLVRSNELMTSAHALLNPRGSGPDRVAAGTVSVGIGPLTFEDVVAVARYDARVEITPDALEEIRKSRTISCSAAWSVPMPPARAPRSSERSSAP